MILIFSKKFYIVYNSYTYVKAHLKSNCNFFFEKNVHFEVGFFFGYKMARKKFFKNDFNFFKKFLHSIKAHLKSNCNFFFEKNVHFEVGFFLL